MEKEITIYGFCSDLRDFGRITLGSAMFRTTPGYQVSSLLLFQGEAIILDDNPSLTGRKKFPVENELEVLRQGEQFFELNKEEMLRIYEGRYIAIFDKNVIDTDENFENLARRVYSAYGYITIYITKVEKDNSLVNIPSPALQDNP